jgi:hypothetical protein
VDVEMGNCLEFWSVAYLELDDELFSDELGWDYFSDNVIDNLHDRHSLLIQQSRELKMCWLLVQKHTQRGWS